MSCKNLKSRAKSDGEYSWICEERGTAYCMLYQCKEFWTLEKDCKDFREAI
jgi:hypothetical protein